MVSGKTPISPGIPHAPWAHAALVLADSAVFFGKGLGIIGTTGGEICFNTSLTGYQEIITDPSYAGQIITFTFPHIGNVGTNEEDIEAVKPYAKGIVIREDITNPSNFRNTSHLGDWLAKHHLIGIAGVDTRALTRHIRDHGAQNAVICHVQQPSDLDIASLQKQAKALPSMEGLELTKHVTCQLPYNWDSKEWALGTGYAKQTKPLYKVVAIDYGAKQNILRCLAQLGCEVIVVPSNASAKDILQHKPDGIFLSNGPGDPAATGEYAIPVIQELMKANLPIFGICLGHQLLALALGAKTEKLAQGHRGANQPVKDLETGKVEITSQNHGFAVTRESLPKGVIPTHISLFDNTLEGIRVEGKPFFAVQYHPESSPGPHDSHYLFERFVRLMKK